MPPINFQLNPTYGLGGDQVSAQSNLRFGRRCHLKIFKMADMVAILDIGTELFKQF